VNVNPFDYKEPASEVVVEMKISKSRFLGHVRICRSEDDVRMKLREVCDLHKQATHNCWAYRIGEDSYREYFSDDGEPAGTAGKPILGAIARLDLSNTLIVVTRYFGGIKLGVRGLIEAYGSTATDALNASGVSERTIRNMYRVVAPYDMVKTLHRLVHSHGAAEEDVLFEYGERVGITCSLPRSSGNQFENALEELLNMGRIFSWNGGNEIGKP